MDDRQINRILESAARPGYRVQPAVLARITNSIHTSLRPVRSAPTWVLAGGLFLLCAAVAVAGAAWSGFAGFEALSPGARVIILSILALLAWIVSRELVSQWTPGSRRDLAPGALIASACGILLCVFALLFTDSHSEHWLAAGLACLSMGVLHAIPAAVLATWLLRRGLAVAPVAAGAIAGTLGGLSGVTVLELHCPNLDASHVVFWHVAVIPVSAALGALVGWLYRNVIKATP
jgi:hypothetical protein